MKRFKNQVIIKVITHFIIPYIILYSLYIQLNGEVSPGGGFQAGAIFASALIAFEIINGKRIFNKYLSLKSLVIIATLGVIIYVITGAISLIYGDNFLDYYSLNTDKHHAQETGIFAVEVGVGLTVSAVLTLIYSLICMAKP